MKKITNRLHNNLMQERIKKGLSALGSMLFTLLMCVSLPMAQASDREIYTTASSGNITVMLAIDQSLSMSLTTWGITACDAPDGYIITGTGSEAFGNTHAANHPGETYRYTRHYCTAKAPVIKSRVYWKKNANNAWYLGYQVCTNQAMRYEDCVWGSETTTLKSIGTGLYVLPGTIGFQTVSVYYDLSKTQSKLYDRMTRVKDALYELLYGTQALDGEKGVGLSLFPVGTGLLASKGHIQLPARPLKEVVGSTNQRDLLMQAVAAMGPMGLTPTTNVYADIAAYFFGTNTLRRPLQNLVAVQRIEWKQCSSVSARSADGSCQSWDLLTNWHTTLLPTSFDLNSLTAQPLSVCQKDINNTSNLVGMTDCYTTQRTMPRYVMAMPMGETDVSKALWRTCVAWQEDGTCNGAVSWRTNSTSLSTTWSSTQPNDARLIPDMTVAGLTDAQKAAAYVKISYTDFDCPTTGMGEDSSYKITCFGDIVEAPAVAVKRMISSNSPDGVWKECTGGNDSDGTCRNRGFTPDNGWSNAKPNAVTDDLETSFCSNLNSDLGSGSVPGNETDATGICYFSDGTSYQRHIYANYYAGFSESVSESKNISNSDPLQQTYKRPDAVQAQIDANKQCGGQGIYILSDGAANASTPAIQRALYRAALTSTSTISTARNFSCSNPDFGSPYNIWGCAANFSKTLLNSNSGSPNPINMPIRTATFGFGADYADLPVYDSGKTTSENAAIIKDFYGVSDYIKGLALLGIYGKGGWYKGASTDEILSSLKDFFSSYGSQIPALNSGAVTIPVDALNPVQIQNYAYYPEFTPKPDTSYPLWLGNLKKFGVASGIVVDSEGKNILDSSGDTRANLSDYWQGSDTIAGALGKLPLRGDIGRKLLINQEKHTDNGVDSYIPTTEGSWSNNNGLMSISKDYLDSTDANRGYLLALLGYSLSQQQADLPGQIDATILSNTPVLRQMGGAQHSTPILLTQSGRVSFDQAGNATTDESSRDEYVGVGTQQGLFQVVNAKTGVEKFAFVPYEMLQKQKKGFLDSSLVTDATGTYHGIDAPWVAYSEYVSKGDSFGTLTVGQGANDTQGKQWIYGGLRMGGRSYYSLDLGDINNPKLKFWINPDGAKAHSALSFMGQSWSKPTLAYVKWKGTRKLVMLVGGGYDEGYESDAYHQTNGQGAGVYMFDANNGDLLWWASSNPSASTNTGKKENALKVDDMSYSVTGRINTLDRNSDGLVDALYFGDLGGQVWRVDINNSVTGDNSQFATRAVRLLNLHGTSTVNNTTIGISPRFYEAPNISVYNDDTAGKFVAVAIGSGNRSQPLTAQYSTSNANGRVNDAVYVIYDKDIARTDLYTTTLANLSTKDLTLANLTQNTDQVTGAPIPYKNNGWYYRFSTLKTSHSTKIQSAKVFGELTSINKNLYVSVYDAAQDGTAGSCGTGIKGATIAHRFCLPYGKCAASSGSNELYLGSGISGINIGSGDKSSSLRVVGGVCTGSNCLTNPTNTNTSLLKAEHTVNRTLAPKLWYKPNAK